MPSEDQIYDIYTPSLQVKLQKLDKGAFMRSGQVSFMIAGGSGSVAIPYDEEVFGSQKDQTLIFKAISHSPAFDVESLHTTDEERAVAARESGSDLILQTGVLKLEVEAVKDPLSTNANENYKTSTVHVKSLKSPVEI